MDKNRTEMAKAIYYECLEKIKDLGVVVKIDKIGYTITKDVPVQFVNDNEISINFSLLSEN